MMRTNLTLSLFTILIFFVFLHFYFILKIITDEKRNIMRARRMETQKR